MTPPRQTDSWDELHSVRHNFIRSRSRWPSPRRARARAWMACWDYHQQLRRQFPQWWRPPYDHLQVWGAGGSVAILCVVHDPDTLSIELRWVASDAPVGSIIARVEGAELRRLARWLYAGTLPPADGPIPAGLAKSSGI